MVIERQTGEIYVRQQGRALRLTLTRPESLNALTAAMSLEVEQALDAVRDDDTVALVIVDAEGDKAFCAGGDIADVYAEGVKGNFAFAQDFWTQEYRMNLKMSRYPKPVVSLLKGFTLGGGVGLGCHCSHRVAGASLQLAMPECGIGLVPDVGGSYLLSRAPGELGIYLGLTGARMSAADAIHAGFADTYVHEDSWSELIDTLCNTGDVGAIDDHAEASAASHLKAQASDIDTHFSMDSVNEIVASLQGFAADVALEEQRRSWAELALKALRRNSPMAMEATAQVVRAARDLDLEQTLKLEFRTSLASLERGDFLEGIRAQIIDRDRKPRWKYALGEVPTSEVTASFAPLGAADWKP